MKHISIRVPWHDNKWNGTVCNCPKNNPFCMMLHNIFERKDGDKEEQYAGKRWTSLRQDQFPACVGENGGFMNDKPYKKTFKHVYAYGDNPHAKLRPTEVDLAPYTFFGVPFRYFSLDTQNELDRKYPNLSENERAPFNTSWVYGRDRQFDILERFRSNIEEGTSLSVFYCKSGNPIDEDSAKLIVGIGEISKVHPVKSYDSDADYTYPFWELIFEHGIREDLKKSKGFLLPYHEYLSLDEEVVKKQTGKTKQEVIDEIKLTIQKLGNSQKIFNELSYGCEYVSNHSMLIILNAARKCLENVISHDLVGRKSDWELQIRWINSQIAKVKEMIGPFPSFAECLSAIGINYAYIIEQDLRNHGYCGVKDNPWLAFDQLMKGEIKIEGAVYKSDLPQYRILWSNTIDDQKEVLELLSRFEIPSNIIKRWFERHELHESLLCNPYIISEDSFIEGLDPVTTDMIDLGVFADAEIQGEWKPKAPSLVESGIDRRRIRSFVIGKLANSLNDGDTLLSVNELEEYLKECLDKEKLLLTHDYLLTNKEFIEEKTEYVNLEKSCSIQLKEYAEIDKYLRKKFHARAGKTVKSPLTEDWDSLVKNSIESYDEHNERSRSAVEDQIKALKMFSTKRLSVLAGPAGTGKTTVVKAFLSSSQIQAEGVLLLAPTGKARVRLGSMSNDGNAQTVAQFLTRQGCFDWSRMVAYLPDETKLRKYSGAKNIIIDECSMLTCKDFYILLNALDLKVINRIILIGDPYQLPPIGPGRPFADLYNYLNENKDKNLKDAITRLRTVVRTIRTGESDVLSLASWFSGTKPAKDSDQIFERIISGKLDKDLAVYTWNDENDLKERLAEVLSKELPNEDLPLSKRILHSIGLDNEGYAFTHPEVIENFQVLSPVRNPVWGTYQLNNYFQEWVKEGNGISYSVEIVPNSISYLDKVIQLKNEQRGSTVGHKEQLSNGQIGYVKFANKNKKKAEIVFTGIPEAKFTYYSSKSDEAESNIDLAYAITIHKSQGSDFNTVLVILPKSGPILSRELIYTALTRAKQRLILLVQDNISWLMEYSKPQMSVLARRNSNLFEYSVREDALKIPFVEGLIHKTSSGLIVRSKSEVIIANMLYEHKISFEYEKMIEENGRRCIPDFTFEDASGDTIIWEHLGMLDNPAYKQAWEKKLAFYKSIGFVEGENLFTTADHENGSFDSTEVAAIIEELEDLI